ncbi:alpha/beta fold hydrolase [Rhizorhabdus sp.]|jgi:pimeloyl-ACP methyl ester carboxylesterase|uniref:alpha/beta fold hydrolase n=1 Tax=Rhizorhabdus sp. TaxID=1968843 RepID=UPI001B4FE1E6|nr:alpha/beta fold hydrolase [Rhizorhabdus sp.]MBP8232966.1 alpha/beta fold hydrolase [Rhizorhabdus sp.]
MTDIIRKAYVDCSAGQIHLSHIEGSATPAVFLHQTASSGKMWHKVMRALAGSRGLYALDTPGFGGSFDPPQDASPAIGDYARWFLEALDALGIDRLHLAGHHTGACIAVELASLAPDRVASISLIGPVPLTAEERVEFSRHFGTPFKPGVSGAYLLDNWEYLRNLGAHADPLLIHREMADQLRAWWGRVQSYRAVWDYDFTAAYVALACPVMIGAAPTDVLAPYLDRAMSLRPDARVMALEGANFEPDLDTDNVARELNGFFSACEP